jgi:hypothetical protein
VKLSVSNKDNFVILLFRLITRTFNLELLQAAPTLKTTFLKWDLGSIPAEANDSSCNLCVQTSSEAHPASYPMGTGSPFPGGKAQKGCEAYYPPPSSAEVKN